MNKIKIQRIDIKNFINFIDKVISIDEFISIKLHDNTLSSNCYLPDKDAVKIHSVQSDIVLEFEDASTDFSNKPLKIAFLNGTHATNALRHFTGVECSAEIEYKELANELIAVNIKLISPELTILLQCADPELGFIDMTDEQIASVFNTNGSSLKFEIQPFMLDEISSLFKLEKENDTFNISSNEQGIHFAGKTYSKLVNSEVKSQNNLNFTFYKKYLDFLDKESYEVYVFDNKCVWNSIDSSTMLTVAVCINMEESIA